MVMSINELSDKSVIEDRNLEEIKSFIKYKYPYCPAKDINGEDINERVSSKVKHRWDTNQLEEMKERSRLATR